MEKCDFCGKKADSVILLIISDEHGGVICNSCAYGAVRQVIRYHEAELVQLEKLAYNVGKQLGD